MKLLLIILFISSSMNIAFAENWVRLDDEFYADKDSIIRKGDLSEIVITVAKTTEYDPGVRIKMDCIRRTVFINNKELSGEPGSRVDKILKLGCKKTWEFWK